MIERRALPLLPRCFNRYCNLGIFPGASQISSEVKLKNLLVFILEDINNELEQYSEKETLKELKEYSVGKYLDPVSLVQYWMDNKIEYVYEYTIKECNEISMEIKKELLELMACKDWILINDLFKISEAIDDYKVLLKTIWPPLNEDEEKLLKAELGYGWFPEKIASKYFPNYIVKYGNRTYRVYMEKNKFNGIDKLEKNLKLIAGVKVNPIKSRKRKGSVFPWADITQVTPKRFLQVVDILIQWIEIKDKYLPFDYWTRALREQSILGLIESGEILTEPGEPPHEDEQLYLKCGGICSWDKTGVFGDPEAKLKGAPYIDKSILESNYYYPIALLYLNYISTFDPREKFTLMLQLIEKLVAFVALFACALVNYKVHGQISNLIDMTTFKSTGIGTWLNIIRKLDDIKSHLQPYDSSFSEFLRPSNLQRVSVIGKLRNKINHPTKFVRTEEAQGYINEFNHHVNTIIYSLAKFMHQWDLVIPEIILYENKNTLQLRKLAGSRPYNFSIEILPDPTLNDFEMINKPCIKNCFTNELIPLTPFITWQECPICNENELFYLNQYNYKFGEACYASFVTQHIKESVKILLPL